jgi:hypothetical protein
MSKPIKRQILVDYTDSGSPFVISATIGKTKYKLKGRCKRCGRCCKEDSKPCKYLIKDGRKHACGLGWRLPFGCRLYPLPNEEILKNCGYKWEKV